MRLLLPGFLLLVLLLAGCSSPTGTASQPTRTVIPTEVPVLPPPGISPLLPSFPQDLTSTVGISPTIVATPTGDLPSPVLTSTLSLWTTEQGKALELVRELVQEFGEQVGVQVHVVAQSPDNMRIDLITALLTNKALPDIIWGNQDDLAELLIDGQLQPVGEVGGAGNFIPAAIMGATFEGQLWGMPISTQDFLLLFYNRAMVQQLPATTDELISLSGAFREANQYGMVAGWTEARWVLAWLNGFGGSPTTPDGMQPTLNTPQMLSTLNLLLELYLKTPGIGYAEGSTLFAGGQVAMAIDGDWAFPMYNLPGAGLDLGIAPMPRVPATGRLAASAPNISYLMFLRTLNGEKLILAHTLAGYLATPNVQTRIARTVQRLPALRVALATPAITSDPLLAAAAAQADEAIGLPPTRALRCALRGIESQLESAFTNEHEVDQQQILEAMQQTATACLSP